MKCETDDVCKVSETMADKVWRCSHCAMQRTQEQKPDRAGCPNDRHGHHSWSLIQW